MKIDLLNSSLYQCMDVVKMQFALFMEKFSTMLVKNSQKYIISSQMKKILIYIKQ
jgi:hypothetical protein